VATFIVDRRQCLKVSENRNVLSCRLKAVWVWFGSTWTGQFKQTSSRYRANVEQTSSQLVEPASSCKRGISGSCKRGGRTCVRKTSLSKLGT